MDELATPDASTPRISKPAACCHRRGWNLLRLAPNAHTHMHAVLTICDSAYPPSRSYARRTLATHAPNSSEKSLLGSFGLFPVGIFAATMANLATDASALMAVIKAAEQKKAAEEEASKAASTIPLDSGSSCTKKINLTLADKAAKIDLQAIQTGLHAVTGQKEREEFLTGKLLKAVRCRGYHSCNGRFFFMLSTHWMCF